MRTDIEPRDRNSVQSVEKAIGLLRLLGAAGRPLPPAELAHRAGLSRTTVHRLLRALEKGGAVARPSGTADYALGYLAHELASVTDHHSRLRATAAAPMLDLRRRCGGETVGLYVPVSSAEFMCIDMLPGLHGMRHVETLYRPIAMALGATSSIFLAAAVQRHGWDMVRAMLTEPSSTEPVEGYDVMVRLVQMSLEQGYAASTGLRIAGLGAISAPILGQFGQALAAVTVSGLAERFRGPDVEQWIRALRETTAEIARRLADSPG